MELRQLRSFEMVARCGSFSRAAEELNLTQPAVSAQMQALERELGMPLLERLPRRTLLTPAGQVLLPLAQSMLNLEDEALRALAQVKGLEAGTLRVGASPTIGAYYLPLALGLFKQRYPGLRLIVEIQPTQRIADGLITHALDIALVEAQVTADLLVVESFLTDELVLIVPADHPWAMRTAVQPEEMVGQPFIAREPGSGTRSLVEERLRAVGVRITPVMELGSIEAIKNAVVAGLGIAFLSRLAVADDQSAGRLKMVKVEGLDLRRPFYRLLHRQRQHSPAVHAFIDLIAAGAG